MTFLDKIFCLPNNNSLVITLFLLECLSVLISYSSTVLPLSQPSPIALSLPKCVLPSEPEEDVYVVTVLSPEPGTLPYNTNAIDTFQLLNIFLLLNIHK